MKSKRARCTSFANRLILSPDPATARAMKKAKRSPPEIAKVARPNTSPATPGLARNQRVWLGIVLMAAVLAYLPMFKASFLNFDDEIYITENPLIRNLDWDNLK